MELKGKKIVILGDSVTAGFTLEDINFAFPSLIAKDCNCEVINYGVPGTSISKSIFKSSKPSFDEDFNMRAKKMDDGDLVIVFGGSNDYGHSLSPIGNMDSIEETTFYGALKSLYSYLKGRYPKVLVITPLDRFDDIKEVKTKTRGDGSDKLVTFVNIIKEVAGKYSIPVLDLYTQSGINPHNKENMALYMPDGMHPSIYGHRLIANKIEEFIYENIDD